MAQPQGFWASAQASTSTARAGKGIPLGEHIGEHIQNQPNHYEAYVALVPFLRTLWNQVLTPTGRPKKGPVYFAITLCDEESEYGITDSKQTKGKRWACKTCSGFARPVWSDGPLPDMDDIEDEYASYMAGGKTQRQVRTFQ